MVSDSSEVLISKIYQDSSYALLQVIVACSELDLSQQSVRCDNVNNGENCIDKVEVHSNNGQSAIIRFNDLRPGQFYMVTIAAKNTKTQDLVANYTVIFMGESTNRNLIFAF